MIKLQPKYKRGMKITIEIAEIHTHFTDDMNPYNVYRVKGINSLFLTDGAIDKLLIQHEQPELMSDEDFKTMFPRRMNRLLRISNMTQKELAEIVGITESTMSRYCRGERMPKATTIAKIADVFGIEVNELLAKGSKDER